MKTGSTKRNPVQAAERLPQRDAPQANQVDCLVDARCASAQSLTWDRIANRLFWLDAAAGQLLSVSLDSGVVQSWRLPCPAKTMALAADGRILLGLVDGVYLFNLQTHDLHFLKPLKPGNDVNLERPVIDAEGAHWRCTPASVARFAPDGRMLSRIALPIPTPTSCCFGGPTLRLLFIGSQREALSPASLTRSPGSGGIFMVPVEVAGVAIRRFGS